ncbi:4-alpha-glucanotransferase [Thiosulfatimonas sediminis]|uniref:4-alpha-glucanotransferase n=1 Tax=Thiosulfatimonas sediminis TaxID=2675054 RepID=A0A6F8PST3_9GAMM|nr:4-alpha-glucanotransferase [Thiosulfatimonas sediminis]BBP45078.1 4-alpha-glucanotransferase [Thiosulfatimonas sediminis]
MKSDMHRQPPSTQLDALPPPRQAGVLLHITSLPNPTGNLGCLDQNAWRFLDWLESAGLSIWQTLPLNHTHSDLSPYSAMSAFALNPMFLPDDWQTHFTPSRYQAFLQRAPHWLEDYALFVVIRETLHGKSWLDWPQPLKFREPAALAEFSVTHHAAIEQRKQQQCVLDFLWQKLKHDANRKGIQLFGDMPIFVALDSADVWSNTELFLLDENLLPEVVAGVPPDYFSETGQRWGNPHYDWQKMQQQEFTWWQARIEHALQQFDLLRIDHFRGLQACWQIAAAEETAVNGTWQEVPGHALLTKLQQAFPDLPLIAEDLGLITPEVVALKEAFSLPGMSVLQFGFNGLPDNPHALDAQVLNSVVYTGTHDNDTSVGWFSTLDDASKDWIWQQLSNNAAGELAQIGLPEAMPWPLIVAALQSVAQRVIVPMQDLLMLDSEHRMNVPGVAQGNWRWQFEWSQLPQPLAEQLKQLLALADRIPNTETQNSPF